MAQYKTPGVYVEEKSMLAPSVAGVATAVPAFIGYTQTKSKKEIQPITSLLEYQAVFGEGKAITCVGGKAKGQEYALYDSIRLFYDNGGGACYVVSIGTYDDAEEPTPSKFNEAFSLLEQQADVTLLVFPDAATLLKSAADLGSVQMQALLHCQKMGGRFAILDVKLGGGIKSEETAAPVVEVSENEGGTEAGGKKPKKPANAPDPTPTPAPAPAKPSLTDDISAFRDYASANLCYGAAYYPYIKTTYSKDIPFGEVLKMLPDENSGDEAYKALRARANAVNNLPDTDPSKQIKINAIIPQIPGYAEALAELKDEASIIPPSGAMAGIYAATDGRVGVWQAPANVGVASVKDLTMMISDFQQEEMNVDPISAKSVNAIRYFKGKGILVWGARTLDGGSNEWRYVPVRRLFSYVEQSVKLSTFWAVFQPNDTNTWIKIKCQISNFLSTLWRDGALAGSSPDEAFFVEVGEGVTMTQADINDGYLRVRIGLAAVRPAEFIVLEFSHKVNE